MPPVLRALANAAVLVLSVVAVAACGGNEPSSNRRPAAESIAVAIKATDTSCEVAKTSLPAGTNTFAITNAGTQVTEVYVYAPGDKVVTEKENIAPGTSTVLDANLTPGTYQIACKPGMKGSGIRTDITVAAPAK